MTGTDPARGSGQNEIPKNKEATIVKKIVAALAAGAALLATAGTAAAQDWSRIRIATEGAYPPWNTTNAAGQLEGFEIDLAKDLCRRMEAECEIVAQEWDGIIPGLTTGRYDAIMAGMSVTDERRQVISFAGPYATEPIVFSALKDSPLLKLDFPVDRVDYNQVSAEEQQALDTLAKALEGQTVGVQVATTHQNMMQEYLPDVDVQTYDKVDSIALDLLSGRIDAMLADSSATRSVIETQGGVEIFGPGFTGGPIGIGVGVGVRQGDDALREKFDAAIKAATEDGTIARMTTQWFGFDASMKE